MEQRPARYCKPLDSLIGNFTFKLALQTQTLDCRFARDQADSLQVDIGDVIVWYGPDAICSAADTSE